MKTRYIIAIAAAVMMFSGCQRELLPESDVNFGDGQIRYSVSNVGVKSSADDVFNTVSLSLVSGDGKLTVPVTCEVSEGIDLGNVSAETKGALINTSGEVISLPDGNKFTVSAYKVSEAQFTNQTATKSGDYWTMDPPQYWPLSTKLTFYAYANAGSNTVAQSATSQTLTYTVASDAASHQDLMLGYYTGNGGSKGIAEMRFVHPLTAVCFKQGEMTGVTGIRSITISGLASGGTVAMDADGKIGDWTVAGTEAYKTEATLSNGENPLAVDGTTKLIGKDSDGKYNGAFLLVPQKLSEHKVTVTAVLTTASGDVTVSADITSGTWLAGYTNTYTLGYAGSDPNLLPGKFSISATEYVQFSRGNLFCTRDTESGPFHFAFETNQYDLRTRPGLTAYQDGKTTTTPSGSSGLFQWVKGNTTDYGAFSTTGTISGTPSDTYNWGAAIGGSWFTLEIDDWDYLVSSREGNKFAWAKVNGLHGLLIFPDGWTNTRGLINSASINERKNTYADQVISASDWALMESDGVVFLPAAAHIDYNSSSDLLNYDVSGDYWSSINSSETDAHYFTFNRSGEGSINKWSGARSGARSVRLVQKFDKPVKMPGFVDLGLPSGTLWADINIGAESPEGSGYFFAWGATKGYVPTGSTFSHNFNWANAPFNNGDASFNETFFESVKETICTAYSSGGKTYYKLVPEYDAAHIIYKDTWRMPARPDWDELLDNTNTIKEWTENYNNTGVKGYIIKSRKDTSKSIFLPAAGYGNSTTLSEPNSQCNYWTSTLHSDLHCAYEFKMNKSGGGVTHDGNNRYQGRPIRAVKQPDYIESHNGERTQGATITWTPASIQNAVRVEMQVSHTGASTVNEILCAVHGQNDIGFWVGYRQTSPQGWGGSYLASSITDPRVNLSVNFTRNQNYTLKVTDLAGNVTDVVTSQDAKLGDIAISSIDFFGAGSETNDNYYGGNFRLFYVKIYDGSGTLIGDLVPTKNGSNYGLYDKVQNKSFFGTVHSGGSIDGFVK